MIKKTCTISGQRFAQRHLNTGMISCEHCITSEGSALCRTLYRRGCPAHVCWELREPGILLTTEEPVTTIKRVTKTYHVPARRVPSIEAEGASCALAFPGEKMCTETYECSDCLLAAANRGALLKFLQDSAK